MDGTIQNYTLDMAADTKKEPLRVKQYDTNSRLARITLKMGGEPWTIPFGAQIYINVRKTDGTLADATCTREDEHTVLAPITEQMTAVTGTQLGELYFLGSDGDIKSQTFPVVVYEAVMDQARIESSDDFQSLQDALRQVQTSTDAADIAAQYATEQGNQARDGAQRANDAADSIQAAVDAAANAKACESNAKNSELAAVRAQQEVTDYVEGQKAAFVGYSKRESDSKYANALTETVTGEGGVTVEDAWTAPVLGLDVVGKSEQVLTTGAQLLDSSELEIGGLAGNNGAEFTTQARVRTGYISVTGVGVYKLSGFAPCVVHSAFAYDADKTVIGNWNIDTFVHQNAAYVRISLKKSDEGNFTVDDLATLKKSLMLNAGDTALPYEPYTGAAPSPSPDYPQDIISVGTVSTGAQLLNADTIVQGMVNAETGALSVTSSFVSSDYTPIEPGDYVLSGEGIKPYLNYAIFFDKEKVIQGNSTIKATNGKFTVTEGIAYARFRFVAKAGTEGTVTPSEVSALKPMLNAGDAPLPWEPYTGGKPSPSVEYPQVVEVTATGAQLFDASKVTDMTAGGATVTNNGDGSFTVSGSGVLTGKINRSILFTRDQTLATLRAGNYCMSGNKTYPYFYFTLYNVAEKNVVYEINTKGTPSKEITQKLIEDENLVLRIGFYGMANESIIPGVVWPMVNAGDSALPWEPYQSKSAPITLTEPLRAGDWIMCKDGEWGIERWFIQLTFNGSENWWVGNTNIADKKRFVLSHYAEIIKHEQASTKPIKIMCNILTARSSDDTYSCVEGISSNTEGSIVIYLEDFSSGNADAFKAYLAMHPISAIFELATPTWEPLPSATQQALNALTTYAGTTHLTITAGGPAPTVTLDYVKDTHKALEQCREEAKEYTDNQIAAIVAALPTATQAAIVDNQTTKLLQEV